CAILSWCIYGGHAMFQDMIKLQLEELLKERGKTLYWLASPSGADVEYNSLWRLKEGRSKRISFELINRLCGALECKPGDLSEYSPDKTRGSTAKQTASRATAKKRGARAK